MLLMSFGIFKLRGFSGLLALVMAKNMLTSGNRKEYLHNIFLNITLCQIPGIMQLVVL